MLRSISKIMVVVASVVVMATVASAGVKVVSDKNVDAYSVDTIIASIIKPDMTDQQKGEAIFEYLVTHIYHHNASQEISAAGLKQSSRFSVIIKTLRVVRQYHYGFLMNQTLVEISALWTSCTEPLRHHLKALN